MGLTITGIGFAVLLHADPEEVRSPLAARLMAPIPVLSGKEWVDQFTPTASILNVVLWAAVFYAISARWPRPIEILCGFAVKAAGHWKMLMLPLGFAASFAIYLLPLGQRSGGQQWRWFLREMLRLRQIYPDSLVRAEVALAAGTQLVGLGTILLVTFGRKTSRWLLPAPLALFVTLFVPRLVSEVIPTYYLSSKDTSPPKDLPVVCARAGRFEDLIQRPADVHIDEPWLVYGSLLEMPGCGMKRVDLHVPVSGDDFAGPGGRLLFVTTDEHQRRQWWYYGGPGSAQIRLQGGWNRILSSDGELVAWLDWSRRGGPPSQVVLSTPTGPLYANVELPPLKGWISLVTANPQANRIILRAVDVPEPGKWESGNDSFYEFGMDGRKHWGPWAPVEAATGDQNGLRLLPTGWIAWRSGHPNSLKVTQRIVWCVAKRCGSREVHKGRIIHSVDVDAEGRFIAVGEEARIGRLTGVVYVIDTANGTEVFRRYLSRYSRPVVRFPGRGFIAFSDELGESIGVFELPRSSGG